MSYRTQESHNFRANPLQILALCSEGTEWGWVLLLGGASGTLVFARFGEKRGVKQALLYSRR